MKKIILALVLFLVSASAFAADAPESAYDRVQRTGVLRCGFVPWPPGFEVDPNTNTVKGVTKDLFESIIGLTGWKPEFVQVTLGNAAMDLDTGRIDAMCGDGPWTITFIKFVDYTSWALYSPIFVYVRADEKRFRDYRDLNAQDVTLVGIDGDVSTDLAALRFPQAKVQSLINLTDPAQMMVEVADGKADAVILDPVTAEAYMKNNPGKLRQLQTARALAVYPVGMSVKKGEMSLQQTLSRAVEMAVNIGLVDEHLDRHDPKRRTLYSPARTYEVPR